MAESLGSGLYGRVEIKDRFGNLDGQRYHKTGKTKKQDYFGYSVVRMVCCFQSKVPMVAVVDEDTGEETIVPYERYALSCIE